MIESYETNTPMRATYLRMNGITHVEIWDCEEGYNLALCDGEGTGWPEDRVFGTPGQVIGWAKRYCPELPIDG